MIPGTASTMVGMGFATTTGGFSCLLVDSTFGGGGVCCPPPWLGGLPVEDVAIPTLTIIAALLSVLVIVGYTLTRGNLLNGFLAGITLAMSVLPE